MWERIWIGRFLAGLVVVFFAVDAGAHLFVFPPVLAAFQKLALPEAMARPLGILQLAVLLLFAVPRFRVLAAILITGYLGGAVAIQARAGSTPFEIFFPVILGALLWLALFFIDHRARVAVGIEKA